MTNRVRDHLRRASIFVTWATVLIYVAGLLHMVRFDSDYEDCSVARFGTLPGADDPGFVDVGDSFFPPSARCVWQDGTLDLVPHHLGTAVVVGFFLSCAGAVYRLRMVPPAKSLS